MIFYDKWTDGLVHHDTALTGFKAERDFLGETVAALRQHKMRIVVYYSAGSDLLLYLLNRSTGSRPSSSYLPSRAAGPASPPVTGPEHVCLTIDTSVLGPITRAELIPSSQQVALSRRAESIRLFVEASPAVTTVRLIKE